MYKFRILGEYVFASQKSVHHVTAIPFHGGLCVGCESSVFYLKIDAHTRLVVVWCSVKLVGSVRCLESCDEVLYVGTDRGIVCLRYGAAERVFKEVSMDSCGIPVGCILGQGSDIVVAMTAGAVEGKGERGEVLFSIVLDTPVVSLRIGEINAARYKRGVKLDGATRDEEYLEIGGIIKGCSIGGQLFSFCEISPRVLSYLLIPRCTKI